jgi:flagellar protein FlaG
MGMQVTSLSMGSGITVTAQNDLPSEKRTPTPAEQKAAAREAEAALPGNRKLEFPDLKQTTSDLERVSMAFDRRFKFIIDQESREILIKVIDNETDKVIKVLPPEELQRIHSRIRETLGFLFDTLV